MVMYDDGDGDDVMMDEKEMMWKDGDHVMMMCWPV